MIKYEEAFRNALVPIVTGLQMHCNSKLNSERLNYLFELSFKTFQDQLVKLNSVYPVPYAVI